MKQFLFSEQEIDIPVGYVGLSDRECTSHGQILYTCRQGFLVLSTEQTFRLRRYLADWRSCFLVSK
ncbi:BgTH12-05011 [Blumeria graminis f. sp. triticale]|uniref:BgTH12-05011 n=1 Tax=Blumeria graminis f. sp. triticale TaxID=1689686 RepID=A0A9W4GEC1_BLUGR|nr:BgTH12-05011 [Blumeria graminis f. sp. triticale]